MNSKRVWSRVKLFKKTRETNSMRQTDHRLHAGIFREKDCHVNDERIKTKKTSRNFELRIVVATIDDRKQSSKFYTVEFTLNSCTRIVQHVHMYKELRGPSVC